MSSTLAITFMIKCDERSTDGCDKFVIAKGYVSIGCSDNKILQFAILKLK